MNEDLLIKIVIVGECSVGKSNLLLRYTQNLYNDSTRSTIATEFHISNTSFNGQNVRVQFWDTAGQERYRSLIPSFFTRCDGAILVFDVTSKETFLKLGEWVEMVSEKTAKETKLLIIGNKTDLVSKREVSTDEARQFAEKLNVFYWETSAKENENGNVEKAFEEIVTCCIVEKIGERPPEIKEGNLSKRGSIGDIQSYNKTPKNCC